MRPPCATRQPPVAFSQPFFITAPYSLPHHGYRARVVHVLHAKGCQMAVLCLAFYCNGTGDQAGYHIQAVNTNSCYNMVVLSWSYVRYSLAQRTRSAFKNDLCCNRPHLSCFLFLKQQGKRGKGPHLIT